ncbi:MAG: hypothetical protein CM15mP71_4460 [Candidatus Poseidoniales archaeon]|nr:MAG: hypothetical protein CM15mP71_4460 [Candidatus Poseidoniales archaeon]
MLPKERKLLFSKQLQSKVKTLPKQALLNTTQLLAEKEAEAMQRAEVARRTAEMEVQKAQYMLEQERLKA